MTKTRTLARWLPVALIVLSVAAAARADEVRGQGSLKWSTNPPFSDHFAINAWRDADGIVRGMAAWTAVYHGFPGDGGQGTSGYPWYMAIDTLVMVSDHEVYIEGVVVYSPQVPEDEGLVVSFFIRDNGNSADDPADELSLFYDPTGEFALPIHSGNFVVR